MSSAPELPQEWRSMRVKDLLRWLRDHGGAPPYAGEMRRYELVRWIERYLLAATCDDCERCRWQPIADCELVEHPHCPRCGHCMGRHKNSS